MNTKYSAKSAICAVLLSQTLALISGGAVAFAGNAEMQIDTSKSNAIPEGAVAVPEEMTSYIRSLVRSEDQNENIKYVADSNHFVLNRMPDTKLYSFDICLKEVAAAKDTALLECKRDVSSCLGNLPRKRMVNCRSVLGGRLVDFIELNEKIVASKEIFENQNQESKNKMIQETKNNRNKHIVKTAVGGVLASVLTSGASGFATMYSFWHLGQTIGCSMQEGISAESERSPRTDIELFAESLNGKAPKELYEQWDEGVYFPESDTWNSLNRNTYNFSEHVVVPYTKLISQTPEELSKSFGWELYGSCADKTGFWN
jgi:hypothetical protein